LDKLLLSIAAVSGTRNLQAVLSAPILSVIIVAYKSRDEIGPCLSSIPLTIEGGTVEVVVVDNSPGEGTGQIVRSEFPWVGYVQSEKNLGFGRANNLGFSRTNPASSYVLFLNPDTLCNERALSHCLGRLRTDPTIGMISPKLVTADGSMDLACRRSIPTLWDGFCRASGLAAAFPAAKLFSGYNLTYLDERGSFEVGAINGAFMMGRREVFETVARTEALRAGRARPLAAPRGWGDEGGQLTTNDRKIEIPTLDFSAPGDQLSALLQPRPIFDESFFMYGDDLDLSIRVRKAGRKIVYDGSVQITHLKGLSVAKDYDRMAEAIFDANREVYLKHFASAYLSRVKYRIAFGLWKYVALKRAKLRKHRRIRPL
jgi:N-acetylglucosaminyl-diphospho-decaprenol L-rhamnosyltransferase